MRETIDAVRQHCNWIRREKWRATVHRRFPSRWQDSSSWAALQRALHQLRSALSSCDHTRTEAPYHGESIVVAQLRTPSWRRWLLHLHETGRQHDDLRVVRAPIPLLLGCWRGTRWIAVVRLSWPRVGSACSLGVHWQWSYAFHDEAHLLGWHPAHFARVRVHLTDKVALHVVVRAPAELFCLVDSSIVKSVCCSGRLRCRGRCDGAFRCACAVSCKPGASRMQRRRRHTTSRSRISRQ